MPVNTRSSVFPMRDLWDKFLIHGVATPALIGVAGMSAFLTGGTSMLIATGLVVGTQLVLSELTDLASRIAKIAPHDDLPKAHPTSQIVHRLARQAGLKSMPRVTAIDANSDKLPNAAAVGTTKSGLIIVSGNIANKLSPKELEGVIAHEIAHIARSDTKTSMRLSIMGQMPSIALMATVFSAAASLIGFGSFPALGAFAIGAGGIAAVNLIKAAASRAIERRADRAAISVTKNPWALASALKNISESHKVQHINAHIRRPSLLSSLKTRLYSSHPDLAYRQKRLGAMAERLLKNDPELELLKRQTLREITDFRSKELRTNPSLLLNRIVYRVLERMRGPNAGFIPAEKGTAEQPENVVRMRMPANQQGGLASVSPSHKTFNRQAEIGGVVQGPGLTNPDNLNAPALKVS